MRPYKIEINWLDYSVTNEDDMYEVIIWNATHNQIITTWTTSGDNVGASISKYMETSR